MKQYQFLFFDLDDTLLDFHAAETLALPKLFEAHQVPLTPEIHSVYKEINAGLWQALEEGQITREQLLETRFGKTFEHFGRKVDGLALDAEYRSYDDARRLRLQGLSRKADSSVIFAGIRLLHPGRLSRRAHAKGNGKL